MRQSVRQIFPSFSVRFEGRVSWMYLDIKGLVTIGIGNLIDSENVTAQLPFFQKGSGAPASKEAIVAEWRLLKTRQDLAAKGHRACEAITNLRLTDAAIDDLVLQRLELNETILKRTFAEWDSWPADAQLAVLSMAWAMGAGFPASWPKFTAACKARDFIAARGESQMNDVGNAGLKPRNAANALLLANAASVVDLALDPAELIYPRSSVGRVDGTLLAQNEA